MGKTHKLDIGHKHFVFHLYMRSGQKKSTHNKISGKDAIFTSGTFFIWRRNAVGKLCAFHDDSDASGSDSVGEYGTGIYA